jgi:uncharacterized protein YdaL
MAKKDRQLAAETLVKTQLPDFVKAVEKMKAEGGVVIMHQDAFAADYQESELYLLGAAIKYAGEQDVGIHIIGKSGET